MVVFNLNNFFQVLSLLGVLVLALRPPPRLYVCPVVKQINSYNHDVFNTLSRKLKGD